MKFLKEAKHVKNGASSLLLGNSYYKLIGVTLLLTLLAIILALSSYKDALATAITEDNVQNEMQIHGPISKADKTPNINWCEEWGCNTVFEYNDLLNSSKQEAAELEDAFMEMYSPYMDDETKDSVHSIFERMKNAQSMNSYSKACEELQSIEESLAPSITTYNSSNATSYKPGPNGVLTRSGGVNWFNGWKETWYSQKRLPGPNLNIPGRHVASDGTIRDADGYIVVASKDHNKGDVVETSLGTGKVYDVCQDHGNIDIYTDW